MKNNIINMCIKVIFILLSIFLISNIFSCSKKDSIQLVINPPTLNGLYYFELETNGKMIVCFSKIKNIAHKISSSNFKMKILKKEEIIINEEVCDYLFNLANKAIDYGNIEESIILDAPYCELYYKGITQRIYTATNDYVELYKLIVQITDIAPELINIQTQIPGISKY